MNYAAHSIEKLLAAINAALEAAKGEPHAD
jgi:hypothetical protein